MTIRDRSAKKSGVNFAGDEDYANYQEDCAEVHYQYGWNFDGEHEGNYWTEDDDHTWQSEAQVAAVDYHHDYADLAALQDHASEAQVMAVNAQRTFIEARQLLADMAKNRCSYWPVVGIATGPPGQTGQGH